MRELCHLLFSLKRPLSRRQYVLAGVSLMALKYAADATAIWWVSRVVWTPVDYFVPMVSISGEKIVSFPTALNVWLLVWALPFVWMGVTLSVRRAVDAQIPPWVVVAFFVPILNYILMLVLALAPSARAVREEAVVSEADRRSSAVSTALGVVAGVVAGVVMIVLGVIWIRSYGAALFLGTPFMMGAVSAVVANRVRQRARSGSVMVGLIAVGVAGVALLAVAIEGIVCLFMAAPIALPMAVLGSMVGHTFATRRRALGSGLAMLVLIAPVGTTIEKTMGTASPRVVTTAIEVEAPPEAVWNHVIQFSDITAAPAWFFRTGLAYPVRARIMGRGAGAVRFCEFTTGAFREPITAWEAPFRLAFDVADQPPPLQEWSPYTRVYAPHLEGFFRTTRGEFRLVPVPSGRTRLEGRTWYLLDMQPGMYWTAVADAIVHAIHVRVLEHIKRQAETETNS